MHAQARTRKSVGIETGPVLGPICNLHVFQGPLTIGQNMSSHPTFFILMILHGLQGFDPGPNQTYNRPPFPISMIPVFHAVFS